jgi:Xaa-Pro aminopeptidase
LTDDYHGRRVPDVLIYGDTLRSPEARHEVPVAIPDPVLYIEHDGARHVLVGSFEVPRVQALDSGLVPHAPEEFGYDDLLTQGVDRWEAQLEIGVRAVKHFGVAQALVPAGFPLALADRLRESGIDVRADRAHFVERRRAKNEAELAGIRRAQRAAEAGMQAGAAMLRQADQVDGRLVLDGEPLTSERIKAALDNAFSEHECSAEETIVSHGPQTAIGHDMGSGEIGVDEPIVFDLFPRDRHTGCFADMTRTFVVGEPSEELREYHRLVKEALDRSLAAIRPGVTGDELNRAVCELFDRHGYATLLTKKPGEVLADGFFHGLGHGVGLEVHEEPSLGRNGQALVPGDVVTVEPGLYRSGYGGVRLEDLVLVTEDGCENLTDYRYDLEP